MMSRKITQKRGFGIIKYFVYCSTNIHINNTKITYLLLLLAALISSSPICMAAPAEFGTTTPLNVIYRTGLGWDKMASSMYSEAIQHNFDGALYYVPKNSAAGRSPIYRLCSSGGDHMISRSTNEGGYALEGTLGHAWSNQNSALNLTQITRQYNTTNGDHAASYHGEPTLPGYVVDGYMGAYGLKRHMNSNESLLGLTAGGTNVVSNAVAGGTVWSWTHNSKQYVNTYDYGRQIQSSLYYGGANANEGGSFYSHPWHEPGKRQGSHTRYLHNVGNVHTSRAVPLEWNPQNHGGGPDNPVIYEDILMGKDITLDYNGMGAVSRYQTRVTVPSAMTDATVEIPTGYLRAEFDRFWHYDAEAEYLRDVTQYVPNNGAALNYSPDYGGVIISTDDEDYAMGVFGIGTGVGGSVSGYTLYSFLGHDNGTAADSYDCTKWGAVYNGNLAAGENSFTSWIMTGTVDEVTGYMDDLYGMFGASSASSMSMMSTSVQAIPEPATILSAAMGILCLIRKKKRC